MQVEKFMSRDVITVSPSVEVAEAADLLKAHSVRHLPVVHKNRFVGLVTEGDIRGALFPSMVEDLTMADIMIKKPITVKPETPLEDAARIVYEKKIGSLPVIDADGGLQGIITVVDMLGAFVELMGLLTAGSRLDVVLPDDPISFSKATGIIAEANARIISVSLTQLEDEQPVHLFRLAKTDLKPIVEKLEKAGFEVVSSLA